jgi:microcystin-dependent protein
MRGRTPIHVGASHTLGERGGEQAHTLTIAEIPTHTHTLNASGNAATTNIPTGNVLGRGSSSTTSPISYYGPATGLVAMQPQSVANVGGSQAHTNVQPYLTLSFSIALQGIFPSAT